ncbi:signal peptidase I [Neptunomonas concharum]|uniref:signal peptidase I n=1 Tax=Neptunomonas concharum TaxID=1031538 RepID=UPI0014768AFE|nr:signal peptidase I [Neptunomonas concharum]
MKKKRNAWIAGIASFFVPGLGHVYAGAPWAGWLILSGFVTALLISGVFGVFSTFYGLAAFVLISLLFYVTLIISSVRSARRNNNYELRWFNRWYWYVAVLILVPVGFQLLFAYRGLVLGYETFHIPSGSMVPTLEVGDVIAVNTRYREAVVGDVVVFPSLDPKSSYVARVAAVGGNSLTIENGAVIVNGVAQAQLAVPSSNRMREFSVTMPVRQIPQGEFFVLGDWRDNSNDSRFWGTVPMDNLIGKVTYIWFSDDLERIGTYVR